MGMGTLCTGKRAPIYGHGDTLHWEKGPYIWAWGHSALGKGPLYTGMHLQKGSYIWGRAGIAHKSQFGSFSQPTSGGQWQTHCRWCPQGGAISQNSAPPCPTLGSRCCTCAGCAVPQAMIRPLQCHRPCACDRRGPPNGPFETTQASPVKKNKTDLGGVRRIAEEPLGITSGVCAIALFVKKKKGPKEKTIILPEKHRKNDRKTAFGRQRSLKSQI